MFWPIPNSLFFATTSTMLLNIFFWHYLWRETVTRKHCLVMAIMLTKSKCKNWLNVLSTDIQPTIDVGSILSAVALVAGVLEAATATALSWEVTVTAALSGESAATAAQYQGGCCSRRTITGECCIFSSIRGACCDFSMNVKSPPVPVALRSTHLQKWGSCCHQIHMQQHPAHYHGSPWQLQTQCQTVPQC